MKGVNAMIEIGYARLAAEIFGVLQYRLEECIDQLTPMEKLCIQLSFGLTDCQDRCTPTDQIAKQLGVTKEDVLQIRANAISKLRHPIWRNVYAVFPGPEYYVDPLSDEPDYSPLKLHILCRAILFRAGITETNQLINLTQEELLSIKGMRKTSYQKILDAVRAVPEFQNCTLMTSAS